MGLAHFAVPFRSSVERAVVVWLGAIALMTVSSYSAAADAKPAVPADAAVDEKITYLKHIQPLLKESCVRCHRAPGASAGRGPGGPGMRGPAGGLRLDDRVAILKGGKHGKAVMPGKGEQSLLYKVLKEPVNVDGDEIHAMPKAKPGRDFMPLNDDEIELVKKWIDQGAK